MHAALEAGNGIAQIRAGLLADQVARLAHVTAADLSDWVEGVQEVKDLHATRQHMAAQIQRYQAGM